MWLALAFALTHSSLVTAGEVTAKSMKSAALNADFKYTIYLPDGYDNGRLRYPVLYLLHGNGGNENEWLVSGQVNPTVDSLIKSCSVQPFIIVMPGAGSSWWVNGNKDRVEDSLIKELIPHIDATYRTISAREGRMEAGLSAGGFGTPEFDS